MRALVTGANGFVGSYLVRHLLEDSTDDIIGVLGPGGDNPYPDSQSSRLSWVQMDVTDLESIRRVLLEVQPDQIYHLAGIAVTHGVDWSHYYGVNVMGTYNLASTVLSLFGKHTKFLFVSSAAVYGYTETVRPLTESDVIKPRNLYGASKASAEMLLWGLWRAGLQIVVARPFNHTGPGQKPGFFCSDMVRKLKMGISGSAEHPCVLNLDQLSAVRDFTDVRDVVRAYRLIMSDFVPGEVVNVSSKMGLGLNEIVDILCRNIAGVENVVVETTSDEHSLEITDIMIGDNSLLCAKTGWIPTFTFERTLRDMWECED